MSAQSPSLLFDPSTSQTQTINFHNQQDTGFFLLFHPSYFPVHKHQRGDFTVIFICTCTTGTSRNLRTTRSFPPNSHKPRHKSIPLQSKNSHLLATKIFLFNRKLLTSWPQKYSTSVQNISFLLDTKVSLFFS